MAVILYQTLMAGDDGGMPAAAVLRHLEIKEGFSGNSKLFLFQRDARNALLPGELNNPHNSSNHFTFWIILLFPLLSFLMKSGANASARAPLELAAT